MECGYLWSQCVYVCVKYSLSLFPPPPPPVLTQRRPQNRQLPSLWIPPTQCETHSICSEHPQLVLCQCTAVLECISLYRRQRVLYVPQAEGSVCTAGRGFCMYRRQRVLYVPQAEGSVCTAGRGFCMYRRQRVLYVPQAEGSVCTAGRGFCMYCMQQEGMIDM